MQQNNPRKPKRLFFFFLKKAGKKRAGAQASCGLLEGFLSLPGPQRLLQEEPWLLSQHPPGSPWPRPKSAAGAAAPGTVPCQALLLHPAAPESPQHDALPPSQ